MYMKASPGINGDEFKARLHSSWMIGPQCMTFYYHMFGDRIGTIIVYLVKNGSHPHALWIKSRGRGDLWLDANIYFNAVEKFQVTKLDFNCDRIRIEARVAMNRTFFNWNNCL